MPKKDNKDKENEKKEEDKAIGGNMDEHLIKEDNFNHYVKIDVPEWFCSTICAGLNLDDVISGEENVEEPTDSSVAGGYS